MKEEAALQQRRLKMENKQKEPIRKELNLNELKKVTGGIIPVVPDKPDDDNHDSDDNNGGGSTGGW